MLVDTTQPFDKVGDFSCFFVQRLLLVANEEAINVSKAIIQGQCLKSLAKINTDKQKGENRNPV